MSFQQISDGILLVSCLFIILGSLFITLKMRFVQVRYLKTLFSILKNSFQSRADNSASHMILPHRALFTAMSTTLGISTIVGPVIAINLGGPGALLGFLLTSFLGSAATFTEVSLSIEHRKKLSSGEVMGGPMQYMAALISPAMAKWYALSCLSLMVIWSGAQANQLAAILDSPLLGTFRIPVFVSGFLIAGFILALFLGGIKRIGAFSAKLIPLMFTLYVGSCLLILGFNFDKLPGTFYAMFESALSPVALSSGGMVGGIVSTLRWGIFKGTQACEAGIGTQAIPHAMADTQDHETQGALAMLSTYTAGLLAFISGCVALVTETWASQDLPLGISMAAASFEMYFSSFGVVIIVVCAFLFGIGTILGNSYNGSQCFAYLTNNKKSLYYTLGATLMVFIGAITEVKVLWSFMDLILAAMAVPHMAALLRHVFRLKGAVGQKLPSEV